ncbi:hypothetical protein CVT25_003646 [Psilocybe cyanescens]|uniref:Uncharacterized protein n=1 Tax=Psilocybe cyanescens TaxID=93625 RepID=A0A409WPE0_PSICY|nr:hypothetical protein CVT25_003646 [Psilocybe cyanescens]
MKSVEHHALGAIPDVDHSDRLGTGGGLRGRSSLTSSEASASCGKMNNGTSVRLVYTFPFRIFIILEEARCMQRSFFAAYEMKIIDSEHDIPGTVIDSLGIAWKAFADSTPGGHATIDNAVKTRLLLQANETSAKSGKRIDL